MNRPNRSDTHLSKEEEEKVTQETKQHFDELAPKRHTKPQRSEHSSNYVDVNDNSTIIPEYTEFQRLEKDQQKEEYKNDEGQVSEEFVETDYYKDLNCVDKQHHTTGKGFIKMEGDSAKTYHITPDLDFSHHASSMGNPPTNDWIPSSADDQVDNLVSDKPNRSDN